MGRDYYDILEVPKSADEDQLKKVLATPLLMRTSVLTMPPFAVTRLACMPRRNTCYAGFSAPQLGCINI